jgi:hypothetical protein
MHLQAVPRCNPAPLDIPVRAKGVIRTPLVIQGGGTFIEYTSKDLSYAGIGWDWIAKSVAHPMYVVAAVDPATILLFIVLVASTAFFSYQLWKDEEPMNSAYGTVKRGAYIPYIHTYIYILVKHRSQNSCGAKSFRRKHKCITEHCFIQN